MSERADREPQDELGARAGHEVVAAAAKSSRRDDAGDARQHGAAARPRRRSPARRDHERDREARRGRPACAGALLSARARSAFGRRGRKLPACSRKQQPTNCRARARTTKAPTSRRSTRDSSRPPVRNASSSVMKRCPRRPRPGRRDQHRRRVELADHRPDRRRPKPVAVMSRPMRLSGPPAPGDQAACGERAADQPVDHLHGLDLLARRAR